MRGKVDSAGNFELEERNEQGALTGRWQGKQLEPSIVVGRWSSPDGSKTHPLQLGPGEFVAIARIGPSIRLFPLKEAKTLPNCRYDLTLPQLIGVSDKALEQTLNQRLYDLGNANFSAFCNDVPSDEAYDASASRAYAVTAVREPYVGLRFDDEMYASGAHGSHGTDCYVFDADSGRSFSLADALTAPARARLSQALNDAKRRDPSVQAIESGGAHTAELEVTEQSAVCLANDGIVIQLHDYELGGYAFGRAAYTFRADEVRALFEPALARVLFPQ